VGPQVNVVQGEHKRALQFVDSLTESVHEEGLDHEIWVVEGTADVPHDGLEISIFPPREQAPVASVVMTSMILLFHNLTPIRVFGLD